MNINGRLYEEDGNAIPENAAFSVRETPEIKCYKSYKVYNFYNGLFKWSWDGQLLILHRWNAVFVPNLNLVYGNQDSVSRIRIWRVLYGTLLRLIRDVFVTSPRMENLFWQDVDLSDNVRQFVVYTCGGLSRHHCASSCINVHQCTTC